MKIWASINSSREMYRIVIGGLLSSTVSCFSFTPDVDIFVLPAPDKPDLRKTERGKSGSNLEKEDNGAFDFSAISSQVIDYAMVGPNLSISARLNH